MRTIITDNNLNISENDFVVSDNVLSCKGCFSCWTKNNYKCVMNDYIKDISDRLLDSDEIIIITKCVNGSYSSKVKRILERCISFVEPYFTLREGNIHHILRKEEIIPCTIIVYDDISKRDKITFEKLVHANNINIPSWDIKIFYAKDFEEAKKYL